jgi:hypothetical protein
MASLIKNFWIISHFFDKKPIRWRWEGWPTGSQKRPGTTAVSIKSLYGLGPLAGRMLGRGKKPSSFVLRKFQCRPGVADGRNTASFWRPAGSASAAMDSLKMVLFDSIEKQGGQMPNLPTNWEESRIF